VNGEESTTPDERAADDAEGKESFVAREREQRLARLDELRRRGIDPYPPRYDRDHTAVEIREAHGDLEPGTETRDTVRVAGRVVRIRRHGGLTSPTCATSLGRSSSSSRGKSWAPTQSGPAAISSSRGGCRARS